jgi:polyhydroxybutyrate depolymerase
MRLIHHVFTISALLGLLGARLLSSEVQLGAFPMQRISVDGLDRTYRLFVPRRNQADERFPVVVALHGAGGSGWHMGVRNKWLDLAEKERFILVAPDGIPARPGDRARGLVNPRVWNDNSGRFTPKRSAISDMSFLSNLLDHLLANHPADPNRVFLVGHSNGASMTLAAAATMPRRFRAVAAVAGGDWGPEIPPATLPSVLYMTGTIDPLNPIEGGPVRLGRNVRFDKKSVAEILERWRVALGASPEPVETRDGALTTTIYASSDPDARSAPRLVVVRIEGHGHNWPGTDAILPQRVMGPDTPDIDATRIIWDFFREESARRSP